MTKTTILYSTYLLAIFLVIRHGSFYFDGDILTEFGFRQPLMDIALIPVTSSFGLFFLWRRFNSFTLDTHTFFKLGILILTVFIVNAYVLRYDFFDVLSYSTHNMSDRRPIFIILIPIYLSLLLTKFRPTKSIYFILMVATTAIILESFVFHYIALFMLGAYCSELNEDLQRFTPNLLSFILIFLSIMFFEVSRVNLFVELIYAFNFISIITFVASKIPEFSLIPRSFSILYFYILQAFVFTFVRYIEIDIIPRNISLVAVLILSLLFAALLTTAEKRFMRRF